MYIADLHIHSKYSRATSKDCDAPHLDQWARRKGIQVVGTGDFTHQAWRQELRERLQPAEEGFYTLRPEYRIPDQVAGQVCDPRFVVTGEISCIYKKDGRTRKVHNVILLPSLEAADELARRLEVVGNIHSDGRPILGLDSRDLLELTLESCPEAVFVPAHIWTPHFSMFGAFSGFETVEQCFGDLSGHIHALETGLSSDPPMNWQVSSIDGYTLISNSDAHSPAKLGREANLLDTELSYPAMAAAICTGEGFAGTLEFFPEEGKYHLDGHRNCDLCIEPAETVRLGGRCPVCGKKITVGVQHRVEELADRALGTVRPGAKPYESIVPLPEIIAASTGVSATSKKVQRTYIELLRQLGPEFFILRQLDTAEIEKVAGPAIAEGIARLRRGEVQRTPGYDGAYGKIRLFDEQELELLNGQMTLLVPEKKKKAPQKRETLPLTGGSSDKQPAEPEEKRRLSTSPLDGLNAEQLEAATATDPVIAVIAGPGTGKTKTLVARIAHLIEQGVSPANITAVTFTNQAATEMRQRLEVMLGGKSALRGLTVGTFHSICLKLLGKVQLLNDAAAAEIAAQLIQEYGRKERPKKLLQTISAAKNSRKTGELDDIVAAYDQKLQVYGLTDLDDLLLRALQKGPGRSARFTHLLVDEFQDINPVQFDLVQCWAANSQSLFAIGDPDQAIYGFRGADAHCFERLSAGDRPVRTVVLRQNYRSTPQVLDCARAVIDHNPGEPRLLLPHLPEGEPVEYVQSATDFSEGVAIAKEIARLSGGVDMLAAQDMEQPERVYAFGEIAVLARTHHQLDLIEQCLRHDDIPCIVTGRENYLEQPEVQGVLALFSWLCQPADRPALGAALRMLWNCPEDLVQSVCRQCGEMGELETEDLQRTFGQQPLLASWLTAVESYLPHLKDKPLKLLQQWTDNQPEQTAGLQKLLGAAAFYKTLPEMLQALILGQEGDLRRRSGKVGSGGAVQLMTLHGAKGLEFAAVILAGLSKGSLPLERGGEVDDLEEERRLFYVGITRAKEHLMLTGADKSSRFVAELPAEVRMIQRRRPAPRVQQLRFF
ncbi:ATP-dependent DNA helicase pcrA [Anaerotruncus sp. 2789STDY5834896]|uniref:DNA 3'-5' helicase n=1 Tax=uncultured Anaerotruncus sp. TaxID=905011 RepID=A0A1C6IUL5_9FIRM|nr:ATP-dependent DNA helicase pcrA [uncultured Anaerotruncus sp.]